MQITLDLAISGPDLLGHGPGPSRAAADRGLGDGSVLIVEDDPSCRTLLSRICARAGATRIDEAEDGAAALERVATLRPDLVILDILMPRLDGYETCRRLRADPALSRVPILMQTVL